MTIIKCFICIITFKILITFLGGMYCSIIIIIDEVTKIRELRCNRIQKWVSKHLHCPILFLKRMIPLLPQDTSQDVWLSFVLLSWVLRWSLSRGFGEVKSRENCFPWDWRDTDQTNGKNGNLEGSREESCSHLKRNCIEEN